jgi:hypothetical protein
MARISIEVDIEDYINEIESNDLIKELKKRGKSIPSDVPIFSTREKHLRYIKWVLGLQPYHDNERVLAEIKELF